MSHEQQARYSNLVDAKLRSTLVKRDGVIFNTRYDGNPTAGVVKIPVRDTEVTVSDYSKTDGVEATHGDTAYVDLVLNKDKAINEVIDGYDAASVPDNLVADRLDSGSYSMALQMEQDGTDVLEAAATATGGTDELTADTVYDLLVDFRTAMSKAKVPNDGKRWALMSPDAYGLVLKNEHFIHPTDLGDDVLQTGALGKIAGFLVFEDPTLSATTDFITGHPDWCSRVGEWSVPVHVQDLNGSGKYIGASAVQGRKVYGHKVTKPKTLLIKKHA